MNNEHTPGPWETSAGTWDDYTEGVAWEIIDGADTVASIADRPEAEANARLIAEAPAMLEALRVCQEALDVLAEDAVEAGYPARADEATELAMNIRAILARIDSQ